MLTTRRVDYYSITGLSFSRTALSNTTIPTNNISSKEAQLFGERESSVCPIDSYGTQYLRSFRFEVVRIKKRKLKLNCSTPLSKRKGFRFEVRNN